MAFRDVASDSFAHYDIHLLHALAITHGTSATTYSPADFITREQMAAFLGRVWRGLHDDREPQDTAMPFDDVDPDSYAFADIALIASLDITTGTTPTTYSPTDFVTREQMAAFLARLLLAAAGYA